MSAWYICSHSLKNVKNQREEDMCSLEGGGTPFGVYEVEPRPLRSLQTREREEGKTQVYWDPRDQNAQQKDVQRHVHRWPGAKEGSRIKKRY